LRRLSRPGSRESTVREAPESEEQDVYSNIPGQQAEAPDPLLQKSLDAALDALDPKCRLILIMRYFDGWANLDIGEVLSIPKDRIGNKVRNCLQSLKGILSRSGFSSKKLGYLEGVD
jgi:RNA polymerase sigma factor (sigma-70 family)